MSEAEKELAKKIIFEIAELLISDIYIDLRMEMKNKYGEFGFDLVEEYIKEQK